MSTALETRLVAAEKTIAALMRRVEESVAAGSSAFAVMERSVALERVVAEKTSELVVQRAELEQALHKLRTMQAELLQAQKLESIGRLAAGIAHEINTPVQFVSDSVDYVREAFRELIPAVASCHHMRVAVAEGKIDPAALASLERVESEADLEYLLENVPRALDRAMDGLGRIATLVRSLKEFAHPDQSEKSPADINRAILATLTIARNEYKYVADAHTDFGELPPVPCHIGEVNQVFLNLIVNAAHAIAGNHVAGQKGHIHIRTRLDGPAVKVSVSDDGTGIPDEIRHRVFDPFFTTKEVGKGTGQGLAIARNVIVDKHGGTLTFDSEIGRGTTFHVCLPVSGKRKDAEQNSA